MRDFSVCTLFPSLESRNQLYSNTLPIAVRSYFPSEGALRAIYINLVSVAESIS